jgi:hypothetical protein
MKIRYDTFGQQIISGFHYKLYVFEATLSSLTIILSL